MWCDDKARRFVSGRCNVEHGLYPKFKTLCMEYAALGDVVPATGCLRRRRRRRGWRVTIAAWGVGTFDTGGGWGASSAASGDDDGSGSAASSAASGDDDGSGSATSGDDDGSVHTVPVPVTPGDDDGSESAASGDDDGSVPTDPGDDHDPIPPGCD
ncbi:MAG: hypothetical protein OXU40_06310 [Nitrospira sp.]|nr:hypothetical protein [Nitrospira sp.]